MDGDSVVVVGAGRVGTFVAVTLRAAGRDVAGVVTRSPASRARAQTLGLAALTLDQTDQAGTVLLCVADDELPGLVADLVVRGGAQSRLVAHTSGRHGLGVLSGLPGPVAAIHPAMTFTGSSADLARAGQIVYAVTADEPGLRAALSLVDDLGGRVELVPDAARPTYHAALSHAANHLVTLIADSADLLAAAGVADPAALLTPLTSAALANVLAADRSGQLSGDAALTGPVVRGDVETVAAHLAALRGSPAATAYRAMSLRTAERALAAGRLDPDRAAQIVALLTVGL